MLARTSKRGFTLVEILIVVIILGILAAIVIPQFTNASQDARKSSLVSQLQTLRSQIELFKLQHGDTLPNLTQDWTPMINQTNGPTGAVCGPYMQAIPKNPLNGLSVVEDGTQATVPAATSGFVFDYNGGAGTGRIWGVWTDPADTTVKIYAE
jgi:general secretion pathway protein G